MKHAWRWTSECWWLVVMERELGKRVKVALGGERG